MAANRQLVPVLVLAAFLACIAEDASPAAREDSEPDLLARIARETDSIKKAKYQIRLSRVKLLQAMDACEKGEIESSQQLLQVYSEQVKNAWATLQETGRPAHKKPQGFKELDIALREDSRYLEDLKRRFSFMDREPVEKVAEEVGKIRDEVLRALFPPVESRK